MRGLSNSVHILSMKPIHGIWNKMYYSQFAQIFDFNNSFNKNTVYRIFKDDMDFLNDEMTYSTLSLFMVKSNLFLSHHHKSVSKSHVVNGLHQELFIDFQVIFKHRPCYEQTFYGYIILK